MKCPYTLESAKPVLCGFSSIGTEAFIAYAFTILATWSILKDWSCTGFERIQSRFITISLIHGDLFSRHAYLTEEVVYYVEIDESIGSVENGPKKRASPRRNYNDQHPLGEMPKRSTTRVQ